MSLIIDIVYLRFYYYKTISISITTIVTVTFYYEQISLSNKKLI